MKFRKERLEKEVVKHSAIFLQSVSSGESLINVTGVDMTPDLTELTIRISIFPDSMENKAMTFAERHERDLRQYLASHLHMRVMPKVMIEIDKGEKNRQKIEELLKNK